MTDVVGYRERGGLPSESGQTLGGDNALSRQVHRILTPKLPLLNTPGSVLENTIYYDINSSSVSVLEEQATFAKDRISLNSTVMGSTATAYIPSFLFAGNVWWVGSLNSQALMLNHYADRFKAPHGFGFHMLRNIIVYMGSSNIAQIQLSGIANFMIAMACCETTGKKQEMLDGAGHFLEPVSALSQIGIIGLDNSYVFAYECFGDYYAVTSPNVNAPFLAQFAVPLRLPWTSLSVIDKRLSMDTKLLTQPIQIILDVKPKEECFVFSGSSTFMSQFNELEYSTIQLYQEELTDKSMSVRNELLALPEFNVGLPFQYAQSIDTGVIDSNTTPITATEFTVNLSSIINSDLTTFLFMVTANYRDDPSLANYAINMATNAYSGSNFIPLVGMRLFDIELKLNGQRFFAFEEDLFRRVYISKTMDSYVPQLKARFFSAKSTAVDSCVDSCIYELNNSRLRSIIAESHLQNTCRFTNQTFQLSFKIDRDMGWGYFTQGDAAKKAFTLHMCYLFNGVFLIGGDGGTSKLITN